MKAEWNAGEVGDACSITITDAVFGSKEFGVQEGCDILTAEISTKDARIAALEVENKTLLKLIERALLTGLTSENFDAHECMQTSWEARDILNTAMEKRDGKR